MKSQEAKRYWAAMEEKRKITPNASIYLSIKSQDVDMQYMAEKQPYLFSVFIRLFKVRETLENIKVWNNYKQAYHELEEQGLFNFSVNSQILMQEKIDNFVKKVDGICLVPLEKIEDTITETKYKDNITIDVYFEDYIALLENYYNFDHRDFFGYNEIQSINYAKTLGITEEEYNKHSNLSVSQNLLTAKIAVLKDMHKELTEMPCVSFWNHLMENEFRDIANDSVNPLYRNSEIIDKEIDGIMVSGIVFDKIRKLIFKEIIQHSYYENNQSSKIDFFISW